ncbi:hypothetical protein KXD40_004844 [Peronospora effusa]|uniref:Glycosyltransferase 2-like domain-containing protein n=1 Tax=Peronospora effusa TaxID=542832 RepID=A0A3M6VKR9_9STRA|nr:hypothetical protein DD238_001545 [Peronospora effusa]RQM17483.1 hypothetical protein DD237_002157 [Peronospora effusa]UIZ22573.1 hypothetical protein KXD40_004844 [Peronospora effusa]CAI5708808.1 unnamed protein product [Peronospora effusa]
MIATLRLRMLLALLLIALLQIHTVARSIKSTLGFIDNKRVVELDPSVQHVPLDPAKAHLRPPPPQIPSSFDIFVGLSVFRDGFRCGKTIFTGIKRAKYPERLFFGVVDQVNTGDERCLDEYCKMAEAEWPDKGLCPYKDHIRVDLRSASESRGPTLARHQQQKLIKQEEFCLQLDGHSIFTNLWDENLLADWKQADNEMAVLSTYLHHMHDFVLENGDNAINAELPHLCSTIRNRNDIIRNDGASLIRDSKYPQLQALWAAGLSFSKCHAERRVLVDSHTLWMFDGEEFLRASRLWTNGYDIYSPSEMGSVIYHNYTRPSVTYDRMKVDPRVKAREKEMGKHRFYHIVGKPVKGMIDTYELDKYGFGSVRSFKTYLNFSGVTFQEGVKDKDSCKQLHWVPYENATEIEALMGNGWKLQGLAADVRAAKSANFSDDEGLSRSKARLRQELVDTSTSKGPSATPVWLFMFVVVAVLFVTLSNDSVYRSIQLTFYARWPRKNSSKE